MTNLLLGVSGSIAAYKALDIIRLLKEKNYQIKVILTDSAEQFISPLSFSILSNNPTHLSQFTPNNPINEHIELAKWADQLLIAPATANVIAKLAHGIADDLLTATFLAFNKKVFIAPAMNTVMWQKNITQRNLQSLITQGATILGPTSGELACGDNGMGKLLEPEAIVAGLQPPKDQPLRDQHIVITAGPTREPIDPVRFISNHSSGKMGYALAQAAIDYGAKVTLITGPTKQSIPTGCEQVIHIQTAQELLQSVEQNLCDCDIFIGVAAVCDYTIEKISAHKIKKQTSDTLTLTFKKNPDVLSYISQGQNPPITVGFAAETENLLENAKQKLTDKKLDMIVANLVSENKGFNQDDNAATVIMRDGTIKNFDRQPKEQLAYQLLAVINKINHNKSLKSTKAQLLQEK